MKKHTGPVVSWSWALTLKHVFPFIYMSWLAKSKETDQMLIIKHRQNCFQRHGLRLQTLKLQTVMKCETQVICTQQIMLVELVQLFLQQLCTDLHSSEIIHTTMWRRSHSPSFLRYPLKHYINFPKFHFVVYHIFFYRSIFTFTSCI